MLLRDLPGIKLGHPSLGKFLALWEYAGAYNALSYSLAVRAAGYASSWGGR